jgi:hypothetical protein
MSMVMREQVVGAARELRAVLVEVESRKRALEHAVAARQHAIVRAQRRLDRRLAGLPLESWRRATRGLSSIRSVAAGREAAWAARHRPVIREALDRLVVTTKAWDRRVEEAEVALAESQSRLARYGPLAQR